MSRSSNLDRIEAAFDRDTLKAICEMNERDFPTVFGMEKVLVKHPTSKWVTAKATKDPEDDFYAFKDNGASVLAVAHLDTVVRPWERTARFLETDSGLVVHSGALDDRLGNYVIFDMLPKLDINVDILVTTGEEQGKSTAQFFQTEKKYQYMVEFDRGGTDVVMYEYEDHLTRDLVRMTGAEVGDGIFTDICFLDHLGIKGFNFGVGYHDYHSTRAYAYLDDLFEMLGHFLDLHDLIEDEVLVHESEPDWWKYGGQLGGGWRDDDEDFLRGGGLAAQGVGPQVDDEIVEAVVTRGIHTLPGIDEFVDIDTIDDVQEEQTA